MRPKTSSLWICRLNIVINYKISNNDFRFKRTAKKHRLKIKYTDWLKLLTNYDFKTLKEFATWFA